MVLVGFSTAFPVAEQVASPTDTDTIPLYIDGLFEGDLDIPPEMIRQYYGIPERASSKRAATSLELKLWPNGTVPYDIDLGLPPEVISNISIAISNWEDNTCLQFEFVNSSLLPWYFDHVFFTNVSFGCYSRLGRYGGGQIINLGSDVCAQIGVIIHEIGHAVGFWHEQSRPDRDQYISILWDNIFFWYWSAFRKRLEDEIDYRGVGYDYASIMHYPLDIIKDGRNLSEMAVSNDIEYAAQGRPGIGSLVNGLSSRDILQTKCMYQCFAARALNVFLDYCGHPAHTWSAPEVNLLVVTIEAVSCTGESNETAIIRRRRPNSSWVHTFSFGLQRWHTLRITVSNSSGTNKTSEEVALDSVEAPYTSPYLEHSGGSDRGVLRFRYQLALDSGPPFWLTFNSWCAPLPGILVREPSKYTDLGGE